MPFDANDPETKEAVAAMIAEALAPVLASKKQILAELKAAKKGSEVDPAEVERLESDLEKANAQLAEQAKQLKAVSKAAEDATKALEAEQGHTQKLLIENGLTAALTAAGVKDPDLLESASALIQLKHKPIVSADGDKRVAMVGDKALSDFVKEWAGEAGKAFVAAPNNNGGGAAGGSNQNHNTGNLGGTPAERAAAIAARFPELAA